ncbi:PDDEXK nuclease domain-containing protein [Flammeovirga aprica]|uniref:DUF1016 domain-containing protein n=1 Tax=Flammeovirga aprica JL-4 TaxID=694437 RepID=A0A7X9S1H9_9BACT|nr:PDDEXK nuclease domain-containing protein [Flammeovirga aprica]NME72678.1 DUF1016 domain-containing protein [Flammeovirga aprica JL-4]
MENQIPSHQHNFYSEIKKILASAKTKVNSVVNSAMVEAYWSIGKRIVEEEQKGEAKAKYGSFLIKELSKQLTEDFGKGFSMRNLKYFRQFYLLFPDFQIGHTLYAQLSWSHYKLLFRVNDIDARRYYQKESVENQWSVRTLDRNISTQYYQRLLKSPSKELVEFEMKEKTKDLELNPENFIKNPSVLEFLNLPTNFAYTEQELEKALIDDIQQFLLELGKGFAFVERQQLVRTETSDFYIDLVFYNYILKCFVLIEIKTEKLSHQSIGQLDMYVRMYDDLKRNEGDNPSIGILLCADTDQTIAKYSVLNDSQQLFASKYLTYLPTEEELKAEIERQREVFKERLKDN